MDDAAVLLHPAWVNRTIPDRLRVLEVDLSEPMAANVLRIGSQLVYGTSHPRTRARLERRGFTPHPVDSSELAMAERAVTCCSLVVRG